MVTTEEVRAPLIDEWTRPVENRGIVIVPLFAMDSLVEAPVCNMTEPVPLASESPVMMASETLANDPAEPGIEEVVMDVPSGNTRAPVRSFSEPLTVSL